jgi:serine/threonine protein kinase
MVRFTLVSKVALKPGVQLAGRYTIESILGEGGMGTVFSATQAFTERKVAIKVLHDFAAKNETAVQRFVQEARVVATLSHPNIAQVLDGGVDPQHGVFIVMERLDGQTLQQWLDEHGAMDLRSVERLLVPVMNAVAVAHDHAVLHRDIKPDNIFLARQSDGTTLPKLLDFGLAKLGTNTLLDRTKSGSLVGTPSYMSPEQTRGEQEIDARSDVWSMGVVLYQSLTCALPFEGNNIPSIVAGVLTAQPVAIDQHRQGLPKALVDIVAHTLEKDRDQRVASMRLLADEVSRAVRNAQDPRAFAATAASSPALTDAISAALAAVNGAPPVHSASEHTPKPIGASTIAIPAVVRKQVLAAAKIEEPTAPLPAVKVDDEPVVVPVRKTPLAATALAVLAALVVVAVVAFFAR